MAINFFEEGGLLNFTKKPTPPVAPVTTPVVEPKVEPVVETVVETPEETPAPEAITEDMLKGWQPNEAETADFIDNTPDFMPDLDTQGFLTAKGQTDAHAAMFDSALKNGYAAEQFKTGGKVGDRAKACGARFKDGVLRGKRVKIYKKPTKADVEKAKKAGKFGAGTAGNGEIYVEDRENRCEGKGGKPVKKKKASKKHAKKHEEGGPAEIEKDLKEIKKEKKKTGRKMNNTMALIQAEAKKLKEGGSKKQWKDIIKEASEIVAKAKEGK